MIKRISSLILIIFIFMLIGCHQHKYVEEVVEATCTEQGYTIFTCECSETYKDNYVEAKGHSYGEWNVLEEATEEEKGLREKVCSACNDKVTEEIPVKEHVHEYAEKKVEATCTEEGYTEYICRCGDKYKDNVVPAGHSEEVVPAKEATCTEAGLTEGKKCSVCYEVLVAQEVVEAKGHSYGEWKVVKEATPIEEGIKEKVCEDCNDKVTQNIPVLVKVDVNVTFDLNGGNFKNSSSSDEVNVLKTLTLTKYLEYDANGYEASLSKTSTAIWWNYIVVTKTSEDGVYEIQEIVAKNSNITVNYDYVIMWHSSLKDASTKKDLDDIFNNASLYVGKSVIFENIPDTQGSANISMKIIDNITNNDSITKIYREETVLPEAERTGCTFKGWMCSLDNKIYTVYPGYYTNPGNITYTAEWELNEMTNNERIEGTYQEIVNYFDKLSLVNSNLTLIKFDDLRKTTISYLSDKKDVLTDNGEYIRPYQQTKVTYTITISYENESKVYTYEIDVEGYKKLENIAASYVYTEYSSLTKEFFDTMDVIYCAFVLIDVDGNFTGKNGSNQSIASTNERYLNYMKTLVIPRAHQQGGWVIASIGGGGSAYDLAFENICNSDSKIDNLVNNIIKLINDYGFDGVDIDWEIPDNGTKFTKLMKKLYTAVKANNPNHIVTAAIGGGKWQPPKYDLVNSKQYLDYVNLMTYNMVSNTGYHHTSLYKSSSYFDADNKVGHTLTSCSIEESVTIYKQNYGIEPSKIIIGAAFYGMKQTRTVSNGVYGSWTASGTLSYTKIKQSYLNNSNYEYFYDTTCQAAYILSKDKLTFISFDDPTSLKAKCDYVKKVGAAGIMYWQNGQDTTGDLVGAIKQGLSK